MNNEPTNHKEIIALIKRISGQANFIGTPRIYVDIFEGDLVASVWFNQVVYWDGKNDNPIGFYKTYAEWRKELGLSRFQVSRVARECEKRGLVNIMFKKVYGTPKNHFLVVWPELLQTLKATLEKPDSEESDSSESDMSEREESEGSMEGQETSPSLSIEETSPKSQDIESNQQIWKPVIEQLHADLSHQYFAKVQDTQVIRFDGNAMTVGVSNAADRDWLESRLQSTIEKMLVGILAQDVNVTFVVADGIAS